ncbi:MAG: Sec-independent protein translocase protein TatB [Pseudomonadota bacterium]
MFDISFTELLLCFVVALIVLGPERLPKVARTVGRWTGQARGYLRNLTSELDREARFAELKKQLEEANRAMREQSRVVEDSVRKTVSDAGKDLPPKP